MVLSGKSGGNMLLEKMGGKAADVSLADRVLRIQVGFRLDEPD